jgi:hypothetical protein
LVDPALYTPTPFNSFPLADTIQLDTDASDHELCNEEGVLDNEIEDWSFIKYFVQIQNVLYTSNPPNEHRLGILKQWHEYRVLSSIALLESQAISPFTPPPLYTVANMIKPPFSSTRKWAKRR